MRVSRVTKAGGRREIGGFTLVELMVSMGILGIIVITLTQVFDASSKAWRSSQGANERRSAARSLSDFIGTELRAALLPVETVSTSGKGNLQFVINPTSLSTDYRTRDCVFWQAPLAFEASLGDIAEIGYFVRWANYPLEDGTKVVTPSLCRFFVNPSTGEKGVQNKMFRIYDDNWLGEDVFKSAVPLTKTKGYSGLFAENVVGFWVEPFGFDGVNLFAEGKTQKPEFQERRFDSRPIPATDANRGYPLTDATNKPVALRDRHYLPARVRVSIAQFDAGYQANLLTVLSDVQALSQGSSNAAEFMAKMQKATATASKANPSPYSRIIAGLHIYSTEVPMDNAR